MAWTPTVRSRRPRRLRIRYLRSAKTITTMITMTTTAPMPIYMGNSSHCVVKARLELPQARRRKPPRAAALLHWPRPVRQRWRRPIRPLAGHGAEAGRQHQARASRRHGQGRPVRRHEAPGRSVPGPSRPPGSGAGNRVPAPPREYAYWPAGRCTGRLPRRGRRAGLPRRQLASVRMPSALRLSPLPDQPYCGRTAENRGAGRSSEQARVLGHP